MPPPSPSLGLWSLTGLLLTCATAPLAQGDDAGIAGAVNLDVAGTPPGGTGSLLTIGRSIVRNEHIVSNAQGLAQILFLDQTTLTVGPNSDIVIDEFVYDPATKDGQLLMEASVGVFRLIGGETASSGGITVATPFATLGIRGSNVVIEISPNGRTRVTCNYCETVEIQLLNDPDSLVTIFGSDRFRSIEIGPEGFSAPFQLSPEEIAQLQERLTSRPGQNGGIATIPSEPQVSAVVTGADNSGKPARDNDPDTPSEVEQAYTDQLIPNPQIQTETGQNKNEEEAAGTPPGGNPTHFAFTGGSLISTPYGGFSPFALGDAGWSGDLGDPDHRQAIVEAGLVDGQLVLTLGDGSHYTLPYQVGSFSFAAGEGSSDGGTISGRGFVSPNGTFFTYSLFEEERGRVSFLHGGVALEPDSAAFQPIMAFDLQPDLLVGGDIPFLQASMTAAIAPENIVQSPLYFVAYNDEGSFYDAHAGTMGMAALGFSGSGPDQSSILAVTLFTSDTYFEGEPNPYVVGQLRAFGSEAGGTPFDKNGMETRFADGRLSAIRDDEGGVFYGDESGVYFVLGSGKWDGNPNAVPHQYSVQDGAAYAQGYEPLHVAGPASQPLAGDVGQEREALEHGGYAAGAADLGSGRGYIGLVGRAFLTHDEDGASAVLELETTSYYTTADFSSLALGFDRALYIDRSRIMMQEGDALLDGEFYADETRGALVSYTLVPQPGGLLPGGAEACVCAFMEWGFWAYDLYSGDREGDSVATIPLGTWMTGNELVDPGALPDSGTASYSGHAIANILATQEGVTASYMASGAFSALVDFTEANRSINGAITDLDGFDYSFSSDYTGWSDGNFMAYGQTTGGEVAIELNGSFFQGPDSAVQGIGGSLLLSGHDYSGAGTFMGEQQQ